MIEPASAAAPLDAGAVEAAALDAADGRVDAADGRVDAAAPTPDAGALVAVEVPVDPQALAKAASAVAPAAPSPLRSNARRVRRPCTIVFSPDASIGPYSSRYVSGGPPLPTHLAQTHPHRPRITSPGLKTIANCRPPPFDLPLLVQSRHRRRDIAEMLRHQYVRMERIVIVCLAGNRWCSS